MKKLLLCLFVSIASALTIDGAEVPVFNSNNAFAGSLRQAIHDAAPGDTIVFRIPASDAGYDSFTNTFTITLTGQNGLLGLDINKSLTIDGSDRKIILQRSSASGTGSFRLVATGGNSVVTLANLTLRNGNTGSGGAIFHGGSSLTVRNCTFSGNIGGGQGGAIFSIAPMVVTSCTFTQNGADFGGAIYNGADLSITNSTIFGNAAVGSGAGVFSNNGAARIRNTIIAGNQGGTDAQGQFISEGYNLIGLSVAGSGFGATGDQVGVSAAQVNLGPLRDNGGPTHTMVPGGSSLATDQGKRGLDTNGQPITTDQRNSRSPVDQPGIANATGGDGSDIGAVENGLPQAGPAFTVTSNATHSFAGCTEDDCTLAEAVAAANANADANTINFAPAVSGMIGTQGGFNITNPVTINGPGAHVLTLRAIGNNRLVYNASANVVLTGLSFAGGIVQDNRGGAIFNAGGLTLQDCAIFDNLAEGNDPFGLGGGIYSASGSNLTLIRTTIDDCSAHSFGGGVYTEGNLTATNCTFSGNSGLRGGGIILRGTGLLTLRNCTIANNTATDGVASPGFGGGGVFAEGGAQQHIMSNNLIAGNTATNDPDIRGNYTSEGSNLIGKIGDAVGFTTKSDKIGTVAAPLIAQLGSFANHGGHTKTWSLLANSPAINSGNDALAPATDQRLFARNGASDIGAFEANGAPPPVPVLSAVSRKTHGSTGAFEINLPLTGNPGVECRSGGANGDYTVVFKFANTLASVGSAAVTSGAGFVSSSQSGSDAREYVVNLRGLANAQRATVTLFNVTDSLGYNSSSTAVTLGVLLGDSSGNGAVTATDISQVKGQSGQAVTASNFRTDVTANGGSITASDIGSVKSASGTQLP